MEKASLRCQRVHITWKRIQIRSDPRHHGSMRPHFSPHYWLLPKMLTASTKYPVLHEATTTV